MSKFTLRLRITFLCGIILIGLVFILTLINVENAEKTYTSQFQMNFGDELSISFGDNQLTFGGTEGEQLNEILDFAELFIPSEVKENILGELFKDNKATNLDMKDSKDMKDFKALFQGAEKRFTNQSLTIASIFILVGLYMIYIIVGKALKPIHNLSETVKNINEKNLYTKIKEPLIKDEVGSLACSFNQMLDRLATSFTAQTNFAANAAHELRTPLTTIKAGIQVYEMEENPTILDCKETIEVIKENNNRLIGIVDNLLLLSRESIDGFKEEIIIENLFTKIKEDLYQLSLNHKVTLIIMNGSGTIHGNQTLIYRAIYNLVENGIKYNISGGTVVLDSIVKENSVVITVSDTGPGIPSESIPHIFEPFYRIDKSRARAIGGSGLGLSIVKSIIEKHNGTIRVNSVLYKGTIFTVELT